MTKCSQPRIPHCGQALQWRVPMLASHMPGGWPWTQVFIAVAGLCPSTMQAAGLLAAAFVAGFFVVVAFAAGFLMGFAGPCLLSGLVGAEPSSSFAPATMSMNCSSTGGVLSPFFHKIHPFPSQVAPVFTQGVHHLFGFRCSAWGMLSRKPFSRQALTSSSSGATASKSLHASNKHSLGQLENHQAHS